MSRYPVCMHAIRPMPVPLVRGEGGVIRISGTRIPLQTVVAAFEEDATAEEIVHRYPTLGLADVYATIAWMLQHKHEVDAYMAEREEARAVVRSEAEGRSPSEGIRARLLSRRRA